MTKPTNQGDHPERQVPEGLERVERPERVEIRCRSRSCRQKIMVAAGKEGVVSCPKCGHRAWYSATLGSATLGSSLLLPVRVFFKNQEGAGFCAGILLALAALWVPALWVVRESFPDTPHLAFLGAWGSWLLVRWALRRPGLNNSLVETLKETRTFFGVLTVCFGAFFALYLWRFGTGDPVAASQTLLQLERERDAIANGEVVAFLKKPGWKLALAVAGFLVLFIRANGLRKAVRGTSKRAPRMVRVALYVLTAASAFTFGGALSDGVISRVQPVLNARETAITEGFARYAEREVPSILDTIIEELVSAPAAPVIVHQSPPAVPDRGPPGGGGPGPVGPPSGPSRPSAPDDPRGRGSPPAPDPKEDLGRRWGDALGKDIYAARDDFRGLPWRSQPAAPWRAFSAPGTATPSEVAAVDRRSASSPSTVSESGGSQDLHDLVHAAIEYKLDDSLSLAEPVRHRFLESDPFKEQLKALTDQLVDAPFKDAIQELVSGVISATLKNTALNARDWIRQRIQSAKANSPLLRLRQSVADLRGAVASTLGELNATGSAATPHVDAAVEAIGRGHFAAWQAAASSFAEPVKSTILAKYPPIEARLSLMPTVERASIQTRQIEALQAANNTFGRRSVVDVLREIERSTLETDDIKVAADKQAAEEEAQAAVQARREEERRRDQEEAARRKEEWNRVFGESARLDGEKGGAEVLSSAAAILEQIRRARVRPLGAKPGGGSYGTDAGGGSVSGEDPVVECYCEDVPVGRRPASQCAGPC